MFKRIGKIESTYLGIEDHGIMTFFLNFDFGGSGQGFGGYCLDTYDEENKRRVGTAGGCDAILRIIEACGVEKWEQIKGKTMYALYDSEGRGLIKGIEHLPFERGGVFNLDTWANKWWPENEDEDKKAGA